MPSCLLHCALASCGAVYCNQSRLWLCDSGRVGSVSYHDNLKLRASIFNQTGSVGAGSDRLQLIKFWWSCSPGKWVCGGAKIFGSALLQPARSVCICPSAFFITSCSGDEFGVLVPDVVSYESLHSNQSSICGVSVSFCHRLSADLLQRLRTRERERQRLHQRSHSTSREGRKSLSYDAPPFYMTPPPVTSSAPASQDTGASDSSNTATSADMTAGSSGADLAQRRQLGERLYPKVQSIQPVSFPSWF